MCRQTLRLRAVGRQQLPDEALEPVKFKHVCGVGKAAVRLRMHLDELA